MTTDNLGRIAKTSESEFSLFMKNNTLKLLPFMLPKALSSNLTRIDLFKLKRTATCLHVKKH